LSDLTVVIPCYNSGIYLAEAIFSVEQYPDHSVYEIIIVNDGSTDPDTLQILSELQNEGYTIFHQPNQGPASARNTGILHAHGKYILLLDSDNKIRPSYISTGIRILNQSQEVGVVYGNPYFFGEVSEERFGKAEPFDIKKMLLDNYIDNCSVIRRQVWEDVGGFDEAKVLFGFEDWEFWLRVGQTQWQFYPIEEILFDYRIRQDSLITQAAQGQRHEAALRYIHQKHQYLYAENLYFLHKELLDTRYLLKRSLTKAQKLEHNYDTFKSSIWPLIKLVLKNIMLKFKRLF